MLSGLNLLLQTLVKLPESVPKLLQLSPRRPRDGFREPFHQLLQNRFIGAFPILPKPFYRLDNPLKHGPHRLGNFFVNRLGNLKS